jgi:hypothetical protein
VPTSSRISPRWEVRNWSDGKIRPPFGLRKARDQARTRRSHGQERNQLNRENDAEASMAGTNGFVRDVSG